MDGLQGKRLLLYRARIFFRTNSSGWMDKTMRAIKKNLHMSWRSVDSLQLDASLNDASLLYHVLYKEVKILEGL